MEDNIFEKWPNWLRYICAIPFGVLTYFAFLVIIKTSCLLIADSNLPIISFLEYICIYIFGIVSILFVSHYVIPKHKDSFILIVTSCICTLGLIALYGTYNTADWTVWDLVGIILAMGTSAICCTVFYYKDKENINNNQNVILNTQTEENKVNNEKSIFNMKFPHCIFYYAHIHILLPVGIVLNLISSVNSAWCFVLAILQIVELILLIKHHKYSYKAFLISEIYFDILYIILNNKLIPFMVGLGTLKIIYMYKRKYILTHSRVEMQYAPTKKENKNIKKLDLSNMVNPYNNKFMLKDKDIAEYILMYNSEDGVCEERQNSKLPQDKIQTSENTWNEYLEKNFTAEGTRTNMQDMLLTNEQHSNAEEYTVKELRKQNGFRGKTSYRLFKRVFTIA